MAWRLRNLEQIDMPATTALLDQRDDGRRYLRMLRLPDLFDGEAASDEQEQELRGQLVRLAIEAYRREEVSQGRLREIGRKVNLSATELLELAEAAKPA